MSEIRYISNFYLDTELIKKIESQQNIPIFNINDNITINNVQYVVLNKQVIIDEIEKYRPEYIRFILEMKIETNYSLLKYDNTI